MALFRCGAGSDGINYDVLAKQSAGNSATFPTVTYTADATGKKKLVFSLHSSGSNNNPAVNATITKNGTSILSDCYDLTPDDVHSTKVYLADVDLNAGDIISIGGNLGSTAVSYLVSAIIKI